MINYKDIYLKKKIYDLIKVILILALIGLAFILGYKLIIYFLPFAMAFFISSMIEPIVRLLIFKLKLKRDLASLTIVSLFYIILIAFSIFIIVRVFAEIITLFNYLNSNTNLIETTLSNFFKHLNPFIEKNSNIFSIFPQEFYIKFQDSISEILNSGLSFVKSMISSLISSAFSLPSAIVFVIVMILATYFFSSDRVEIFNFFKRNLPDSWIDKLTIIKKDIFATIGGYLKTQVILVFMTFVFLSIGFFIGGIKYALTFAFIISLLDFIPMVGTGTIMLPWAIYCVVVGNYKTALLLIIILVVCVVVRQMIEPRILGHNIGAHPLLMLIGAFIGYKMLAFTGVIVMPILIVIIKNILIEIFKFIPLKEVLSFKRD